VGSGSEPKTGDTRDNTVAVVCEGPSPVSAGRVAVAYDDDEDGGGVEGEGAAADGERSDAILRRNNRSRWVCRADDAGRREVRCLLIMPSAALLGVWAAAAATVLSDVCSCEMRTCRVESTTRRLTEATSSRICCSWIIRCSAIACGGGCLSPALCGPLGGPLGRYGDDAVAAIADDGARTASASLLSCSQRRATDTAPGPTPCRARSAASRTPTDRQTCCCRLAVPLVSVSAAAAGRGGSVHQAGGGATVGRPPGARRLVGRSAWWSAARADADDAGAPRWCSWPRPLRLNIFLTRTDVTQVNLSQNGCQKGRSGRRTWRSSSWRRCSAPLSTICALRLESCGLLSDCGSTGLRSISSR
jgi:hypothetical protein